MLARPFNALQILICILLLALSCGCGGPSAAELAQRIDVDSPTYEEDRKTLIEFGADAIDPCIDRAVRDSSEARLVSIRTDHLISEVLGEIDPVAAMAAIERRYETADIKTRIALWSLATEIGAPHNKHFIVGQLDSLALENVAFAIGALHDYREDKEMRAILDESLGSSNRFVRIMAAATLSRDTASAIPVLEEAIADEGLPTNMRKLLVFLLWDTAGPGGQAALRRLEAVRNKEVREQAGGFRSQSS